jgi:hypothetical protein
MHTNAHTRTTTPSSTMSQSMFDNAATGASFENVDISARNDEHDDDVNVSSFVDASDISELESIDIGGGFGKSARGDNGAGGGGHSGCGGRDVNDDIRDVDALTLHLYRDVSEHCIY